MNYNTFLIRYGIDPKCFKNKELFPIKTDTGYLYYLEQETEIVRKCPKCNRTDLHIKAYYKSKMNITINANETDTLLIKRVRFQCNKCGKSFTPKIEGITPYSNISDKTKSNIIYDLLKKETFTAIANRYEISVGYVIDLFDKTFTFVPRGELSNIICIDEFHFSKIYDQNYCVAITDFTNKKLIDIIKNRKKAYLEEYFDTFNSKELNRVQYYISDMYDAYRTIKQKYFPNAIHIVDLFHIISQLTTAINSVRNIVMKDKNKVIPKSKEHNFMSKNWKYFLCRTKDIPNKTYTYQLTGEVWTYEELVFHCIKLDPDFLLAYNVLQDIFRYTIKKSNEDIGKWIDWLSERLKSSNYDVVRKVGKTYQKWKAEITNAFTKEARENRLTNASAEGMNNKIKTMTKIAHGYMNFDRFRKRILLIYKYYNEKERMAI